MRKADSKNTGAESAGKKVSLNSRNKDNRMKMQVYKYREVIRRDLVRRMRASRSGMICRQNAGAHRPQDAQRETTWNQVAMMNERFQVAISPGDLRESVCKIPALKLTKHSQVAIPLPGIEVRSVTWIEADDWSATWRWGGTPGHNRRLHACFHRPLEELSPLESR